MADPTVTVGVVTYNRPEKIRNLFESLLSGDDLPEELIVVDDSDDHRTETVFREVSTRFRDAGVSTTYRRRESEYSMPGARNEIIESASSDVICFLDDDVICSNGWLRAIRSGYRYAEDITGVGGPAIKASEGPVPAVELRRDETPQNTLSDYGEVVDLSERWVPPSPVYVDVFRGANMSFETASLRAIDGFDEGYLGPAIFEEWDVMARLRQRGEQLLYHPEALVYHMETEGGGSRENPRRPGTYWYARNSVRFRKKNFGDVFWRSTLRLGFYGTEQLPPVWKRVLGLGREFRRNAYWLRGYVDGLIKE